MANTKTIEILYHCLLLVMAIGTFASRQYSRACPSEDELSDAVVAAVIVI
jgi:hypothetical protein